MSSKEPSSRRKPSMIIAVRNQLESTVPAPDSIVQELSNTERKKRNIFRKLTKRKRLDEKCESNPNTKPMLILTFAFCLIITVAGGSVKTK